MQTLSRPQQLQAKLKERRAFNERYVQYDFEWILPHRCVFAAGQYVSLQVSEDGQRRSYSVCNSPTMEHGFELLVDLKPNGVGSQFLRSLEFGVPVNVLAPLGRFVLADPTPITTEIVFVATGSGIAPFRSMLYELLQQRHEERLITLYWGMRHPKQLFWEEDFKDLMSQYTNFAMHPVVSQPIEGWTLCSGHVTDCLSLHSHKHDATNTHFYLCGSAPMIAETNSLLLSQGVPNEHIFHEKFY